MKALHCGAFCCSVAIGGGGTGSATGSGKAVHRRPHGSSGAIRAPRLFGFTDVGSEREERDEAISLRDAKLARAVDAVEVVLTRLSAKPTHQAADMAEAALVALRP